MMSLATDARSCSRYVLSPPWFTLFLPYLARLTPTARLSQDADSTRSCRYPLVTALLVVWIHMGLHRFSSLLKSSTAPYGPHSEIGGGYAGEEQNRVPRPATRHGWQRTALAEAHPCRGPPRRCVAGNRSRRTSLVGLCGPRRLSSHRLRCLQRLRAPLRSARRDRHWGSGHTHKPRPERMDQFSTALCPPQRSDVPARHPRGGDRHLEYRRERPQGSPQLLQERDLRWGRQPGLPPGWRGETQDQLGRHHGGGSRVACDQQHHRTNNGYLQPLRQDRQNLRHLAERRRDERLPDFQALCRPGQLSHRHHFLHIGHTLRRGVSDLQRDDRR